MKVIGEKWALLALREITLGQRRFDDIVYNTGAPRDILAARLKRKCNNNCGEGEQNQFSHKVLSCITRDRCGRRATN